MKKREISCLSLNVVPSAFTRQVKQQKFEGTIRFLQFLSGVRKPGEKTFVKAVPSAFAFVAAIYYVLLALIVMKLLSFFSKMFHKILRARCVPVFKRAFIKFDFEYNKILGGEILNQSLVRLTANSASWGSPSAKA